MASSPAGKENSSTITTIDPEMLQDPHLFVLNNDLQFLASLIAYLQGGTGPVTIKDIMTAPNFFATTDAVPTNPNQLLTLGAAMKLFGSSKQLVNTSLTQNPVPPPQPIPGVQSVVSIQEVTAINGTTTAVPVAYSPMVGSLLAVIITQDSTGGGQITWDPLFQGAPVNIGILPNAVNKFWFLGRTDPIDSIIKWFLVADPVIG